MLRNVRFWWHALVLGALSCGIFGCFETTNDAKAVIVVSVHSNLSPPLTRLTATLLDADGRATEQEHSFSFDNPESRKVGTFLVSFGVQQRRDPMMRLRLTGYRGPDERLEKTLEQTFHARFTPGATEVLVAFLSDVCIGVFCSDANTCEPRRAICVPVEESPLVSRAEMPDETEVSVMLEAPVDFDHDDDHDGEPGREADSGEEMLAPPICSEQDAACGAECTCRPDRCEVEVSSGATAACGACSSTCERGQACYHGECLVVESSGEAGSAVWWEAGRVYGIRVVNRTPGLIVGLGLRIATPNTGKLRLALFKEYAEPDEIPLPFPRLYYSEELASSQTSVEWSVPVEARERVAGIGEGFWLFFTLSENTQLFVGSVTQPFWQSTSVEYAEIDEERVGDEFRDSDGSLVTPSVFLTILPD